MNKNLITKSILAGLLIALAGITYLNCLDKTVGSLLFSTADVIKNPTSKIYCRIFISKL